MSKKRTNNVLNSRFEDLDRLTSAEPVIQPIERHKESVPIQQKTKWKKISVYLTSEQACKIDDLAYEYRKATGIYVNRVDIMRMLIEKALLQHLLN